jgi:hypothetical protein
VAVQQQSSADAGAGKAGGELWTTFEREPERRHAVASDVLGVGLPEVDLRPCRPESVGNEFLQRRLLTRRIKHASSRRIERDQRGGQLRQVVDAPLELGENLALRVQRYRVHHAVQTPAVFGGGRAAAASSSHAPSVG